MTIQQIVDYVMRCPERANAKILYQMIEGIIEQEKKLVKIPDQYIDTTTAAAPLPKDLAKGKVAFANGKKITGVADMGKSNLD